MSNNKKKPNEKSVAINGHTACDVEVIEPRGVKFDGKDYKKGETIRMSHECAVRHTAGKQVKFVNVLPDVDLSKPQPVDLGGEGQ